MLGIKRAKADVPQPRAPGAALAAAGLEVALPAPCPGTPSTLGMAPSRDTGFCPGSTALPESSVCGSCSLRCWHSHVPAAPCGRGHSWSNGSCSHPDQHPAGPTEPHGALHLSCHKDLKCIEGSWGRASLTTGKKEKHTRRQLCPCNRLCGFSAGKKHIPLPAGLGFPCASPVKHAAAQQRCVGCREIPSPLPTRPRETPQGCGTNRRAVGRGSRDGDTTIGKASVYKSQIPVTKINLCFPSLPATLAFFDFFKYKFCLGKMEAPFVTNQTKKRREQKREKQKKRNILELNTVEC